MLEIGNNIDRNTRLLLLGVWILTILMLRVMPVGVAKYVTQTSSSDQARVAKFDVEVIPPKDWLIDEENEIIFTVPGNIEEIEVPFIVVNNSEVKVRCRINAYHERLGTYELGEWVIDMGEMRECLVEITESAIGESLFELIVIVEQVD